MTNDTHRALEADNRCLAPFFKERDLQFKELYNYVINNKMTKDNVNAKDAKTGFVIFQFN